MCRFTSVWNLDDGIEAGLPLDADELADAPFHADGNRLVAWKRRQTMARVSVWDVGTGKEQVGWNVPGTGFDAMAGSPDGSRVAAVAGDPAPVKDDVKGKNPLIEPQVVKLWDTVTGNEVYTLPLVGLRGNGERQARVFFSPDGRHGGREGESLRRRGASDFTVGIRLRKAPSSSSGCGRGPLGWGNVQPRRLSDRLD